jgi:hypothetical protein
MNSIKIFRLLIVAELLLGIASPLLAFTDTEPLPPELDAYLEGPGAGVVMRLMQSDSNTVMYAAAVLLVGFFMAYLASLIGLLLLKRWARLVYIATFFIGLVLWPLMGASISTPAADVVEYLLNTCSGAILALLFIGPVRERFMQRLDPVT